MGECHSSLWVWGIEPKPQREVSPRPAAAIDDSETEGCVPPDALVGQSLMTSRGFRAPGAASINSLRFEEVISPLHLTSTGLLTQSAPTELLVIA